MMLNKICRGRVNFNISLLLAFLRGWFKNKKQKAALVKEFESGFAKYIGADHAIAVSSAKTALYLALKALGAKKGDEIIAPAYTVREVIDVIIIMGLIPVFVDINLKDANMDAGLIEARISPKTKFMLMTHIYGCPCDIEEILAISRKYNLVIIEDAAQACGGEYKLKKTGSFGKIGYFSFGILKNLNTLGGGMIVTNDGLIAQFLRKDIEKFSNISNLEILRRLWSVIAIAFFTQPLVFSVLVYPILYLCQKAGIKIFDKLFKAKGIKDFNLKRYNMKFSAPQAAIGLLQVANIDSINNAKINNAHILNKFLKGLLDIKIFPENNAKKNIYLNYAIRIKDRNKFIDCLFDQGFDVSPGQVICCADQEDFSRFYWACPMSIKMEKENVYLPIYSPLNRRHMLEISAAVRGKSEKK